MESAGTKDVTYNLKLVLTIGVRSTILPELTAPTLFMALPRNTFPRGPNVMLIKIMGIVFSWSLRVWVTCLCQPGVQNSKIS
jgi:hypothetical protein